MKYHVKWDDELKCYAVRNEDELIMGYYATEARANEWVACLNRHEDDK